MTISGVYITGGDLNGKVSEILSDDALKFLYSIHKKFNKRRLELLKMRIDNQSILDRGEIPKVPSEYSHVHDDPNWKVATIPSDLEQRWVEITGPVERRQVINALNCGADCYMADFEDATAPTWKNIIEGQINLRDAINKTISISEPNKPIKKLNDKTATLIVRPRGLHLNEKNIFIEGEPICASFFDACIHMYLNSKKIIEDKKGFRFYIPKLESPLEAALWNDVLEYTESYLNLHKYSTKVTVLIETILGSLFLEEMLYSLKNYIVGFNAGRWDYIFSIIKRFKNYKNAILSDRSNVTMNIHFMEAYCKKLVYVCHKRGAFAMGGMSANIPSRTDTDANNRSLIQVLEDKKRELKLGFDGTWIAHPDLVKPVRKLFSEYLLNKKNQKQLIPYECPKDSELLDFKSQLIITYSGIEINIDAALQYISYYLDGKGAVAINNKMEDAATAEISRAQLWQWIKWKCIVDGKESMSKELYFKIKDQVIQKLKNDKNFKPKQWLNISSALLDNIVLSSEFIEFLTIPAYDYLLLKPSKL